MKKNILGNKKIITVFILAIVSSGGVYFYARGSKLFLTNVTTSIPVVSEHHDISPIISQGMDQSPTVGMVMEYPVDFSNDEILMGASHNVFVGKVIKQTGNMGRGIGPETQFEIEVVLNIKGNLQGMVTVDQQGGYQDGILYYVQNGTPLLKPGATYLLATRYNGEEDWYTLNPSISGSQFIINDNNLSIAKLQALAENDIRVKQLEAAYPNEILLEADVENNNALNSYQSLHGGMVIPANTSTQQ